MSETFTDALKQNYENACRKNKNQHESYYCATSTGVTERSLDLNSEFVFLTPGLNGNKNNVIKEAKLQAFMVKEALKNDDHLLPIMGKKWRLLDAERNFAKADLSNDGKGQRLDLLAYEEQTQSFIVLELKVERDLATAGPELRRYTSTIGGQIKKANAIYSVNAQNVVGYIVWPWNAKPRKNDNPWGLIEYETEQLDNIENLKFALIKEPSSLLLFDL